MTEWLTRASHRHEMYCHDLKVMGSNLGWVDRGMYSTSVYYDILHIVYIVYCTKILEVNLFAFAYRLFHRDFSPLNGHFALVLILFPALYIFHINLVGFLNG